VQQDYLKVIFRFATHTLPPPAPSVTRALRRPIRARRPPAATRSTVDLMWFAWALQIDAAHAIHGADHNHARRALLLVGVATGCPANFAWCGHRRTRSGYRADAPTAKRLSDRGIRWADDFQSAADEIHALYHIREWGHDQSS
jgi:hypothetical protein